MDSTSDKKLVFNGFIVIILAIALFVMDYLTSFNGFYTSNIPIWRWIVGVLGSGVSLVILFYILLKDWGHWKLGISSVILMFSFLLFGLSNFGNLNWIRIAGLFILYNFLVLPTIDDSNEEEKISQNWTFTVLLWIDYLLLGSLDSFTNGDLDKINRLFVPVYLYYYTLFFMKKTRFWFFTLVLSLLLAFSVFSVAGGQQLFSPDISQMAKSERNAFVNALLDFGDALVSIPKVIKEGINKTFNPDLGGDPEPVEDPQGLTLEAFEQGDRPFRTGSKVYATSMLEAKTLEKPIEAYVICYTEVEDEFGEDIIQYGKINGKTDPAKFTIISFSQHTVRCSFDSLPAGDYEIMFNASFDFASEIRKKIYLIDRQRLMNDQISLDNKGQDSSSENVLKTLYDIDDTDPEAIYTSGPIELGLGTDNLPIDIGQGEVRETQYSVSIENDWSKGGQISKFNSIYLKIPNTFMFVDDSCDLDITVTNEQSEADYNTYKLIMDDRFSNIEEAVGVSCIAQIGSNSLDPTPITVKYLKAYVDYTYVMQEEVDVEVEQGPTADEGLNTRNDLCCRVEYETEINYYWVVDETECQGYGDAAISSKIADSEKCEDEN